MLVTYCESCDRPIMSCRCAYPRGTLRPLGWSTRNGPLRKAAMDLLLVWERHKATHELVEADIDDAMDAMRKALAK